MYVYAAAAVALAVLTVAAAVTGVVLQTLALTACTHTAVPAPVAAALAAAPVLATRSASQQRANVGRSRHAARVVAGALAPSFPHTRVDAETPAHHTPPRRVASIHISGRDDPRAIVDTLVRHCGARVDATRQTAHKTKLVLPQLHVVAIVHHGPENVDAVTLVAPHALTAFERRALYALSALTGVQHYVKRVERKKDVASSRTARALSAAPVQLPMPCID